MNLNNKGFGFFPVLLAILLISVIGFGGYYVWNENKSDTPGPQPNNSVLEQSEESTEAEQESSNLITYLDDESGITFEYPREWGDVEQKDVFEFCSQQLNQDRAITAGNSYRLSFTNNSVVKLSASTEDFEFTGMLPCLFPSVLNLLQVKSNGDFGAPTDSEHFDESQYFILEDDMYVHQSIDSAIGPVDEFHIVGSKRLASSTIKRVSFVLQSVPLTEKEKASYPEGLEDGYNRLDYTQELQNFVNSISVN